MWCKRLVQLFVCLVFVSLALSCGPIPIERVAHPNFDQPDSISIRIGWSGLAPISPTNAFFELTPNGSVYDVSAEYSAGGHHGTTTFTSEKSFSIPSNDVDIFFDFLRKMEIQRGDYEPLINWTDDYPIHDIVIKKGLEEVVIHSASQGKIHSPWQIRVAGKEYVSDTPLPMDALRHLIPMLYSENEMALVECQAIASSSGSYFGLGSPIFDNIENQSVDMPLNEPLWLVGVFRTGLSDLNVNGVVEKRLKYSRAVHFEDSCIEDQTILSKPINIDTFEFGKKEFLVVILDGFLPNEFVDPNDFGPDVDAVELKDGYQIIQVLVFERWLGKGPYWVSETPILTLSMLDVTQKNVLDVQINPEIETPNENSYSIDFKLVYESGFTETKNYVFSQESYELVKK